MCPRLRFDIFGLKSSLGFKQGVFLHTKFKIVEFVRVPILLRVRHKKYFKLC